MKLYWLTLLLMSFVSLSSHADDTEIYLGSPNTQTVKPNIIFIFDTSGSMRNTVSGSTIDTTVRVMSTSTNYYLRKGSLIGDYTTYNIPNNGSYTIPQLGNYINRYGPATRLELTQKAAIDTISGLSGVNLALMQFNIHDDSQHRGGFFELPMKSIDDSSHKANVINKIQGFTPETWTPIVETVHEAYLYYTGSKVKHAKNGNSVINHSATYTGSGSSARYKSPITETCQKNHIVLFTDGGSTRDGASDSDIRSLMSQNFSTSDLSGTGLGFSCTSNNSNSENDTSYASTSCLRDIAYIMNNADASSVLSDKQTVQFHAVGGFIGGDLQKTLDEAAGFGGGLSRNATSYDDLKESLQALFYNISQSGGTFAAPSVSVNAFNSLEQLDQMYYSVFQPHEAVGWSGNVKRFRLAGDKIVDVNDNNAIDPSTGFFSATAQSYWTPNAVAPDGDKIGQGGMASRLQDNRVVVSNIVSNDLMVNNNRIRPSNNNLTRQLLGTALSDANFSGSDIDPDIDSGFTEPYDTNEFTKLVQWLGGHSKTDGSKSRKSMEDPLHSTPVLLNYGVLTIDGKKVPDSTLFIGTNSGYLHAFDTNVNAPKERFAFIPKELLPVATKYYEGAGKKKYGLDGHISVWHDDTNKDMIINNGEKAYLYVGMRRGGSSYYALDVSNRDQPKLLWQINGKNYQAGPTTGFEELGQSWSKMLPVDIKWNGIKTKALIFAGGYDVAEDTKFTRTNHTVGNAIYMINAKTGALLWKASKSSGNLNIADMKSAITGNVVPIDDNSDGFVNLLYVADLGGRIFRIDFDSSATTANAYATGGLIADLGKNNSQGEHVRLYETLDVVYSKAFSYIEGSGSSTRVINDKPRYMLSIGSGYRAHPLDNSAEDNFYVVFDYNTNGPAKDASGAPSYTAVEKTDLEGYQFTIRDLNITPTLKSNNGFYIKLINATTGEKVLSSALTLNNTIYFTSFRPSDGTLTSSCTSDTGQSRLYRINLQGYRDSNSDTGTDNALLFKSTVEELDIPGIPPRPVLIIPKNGTGGNGDKEPKLLISTKIVDILEPKFPLKKTYWLEVDQ